MYQVFLHISGHLARQIQFWPIFINTLDWVCNDSNDTNDDKEDNNDNNDVKVINDDNDDIILKNNDDDYDDDDNDLQFEKL